MSEPDGTPPTEHRLLVDTHCTCGKWRCWAPGLDGIAEGFAEHLLSEHLADQAQA